MAKFVVEYVDTQEFDDRDAMGVKARVTRDERSLGVVVGMVDGLTWTTEVNKLAGEAEWLRGAVFRALAKWVESAAADGTLRDQWEREATLVPVDMNEVRHFLRTGESAPLPLDAPYTFVLPNIEPRPADEN